MRMYYLAIPKPEDASKDPTRITLLSNQPTEILRKSNSHVGIQLSTHDLDGTIAQQLDRITDQHAPDALTPPLQVVAVIIAPLPLICDDAIQTKY
jgi:hypothetical protein